MQPIRHLESTSLIPRIIKRIKLRMIKTKKKAFKSYSIKLQ